MFTGLVEDIGIVRHIGPDADAYRLSISAGLAFSDAQLGDSIAVNGVCLTIAARGDGTAEFGLAPETLARTNLGALAPGDRVNLERALLPTARLGGHYVQGHVDGVGAIRAWRRDRDALWMTVAAPAELMRYIAPKGYITIDGASLTVVHVGPDWFDVTLVAYSQEKLVLPSKPVGAQVNLEVDIVAKYVERLLAARADADSLSAMPAGAIRGAR